MWRFSRGLAPAACLLLAHLVADYSQTTPNAVATLERSFDDATARCGSRRMRRPIPLSYNDLSEIGIRPDKIPCRAADFKVL